MMFDDLEKYLGELEADLTDSRKLIEEQNKILSKRTIILKEAQGRLEQGRELDGIIPFLRSNTEEK
jgi:hypothetical protein